LNDRDTALILVGIIDEANHGSLGCPLSNSGK